MVDRIAVVIPVRDREGFIAAALDSVFAQTRPADRIVVVDDGSTDGTLDILAGYGDRIAVITTDHAGPAGARNAGLAAVDCDAVAFLDSDDLWLPQALENLSDGLARQNADLAWGLVRTEILPGGLPPGPNWPTEPSRLLVIPAMLFRTEALRDLGGFDASLRFGEDSELLMRVNERQLSIAHVPETVMVYQRHPGNMTNDQAGASHAWFDVARRAMLRRRAGSSS